MEGDNKFVAIGQGIINTKEYITAFLEECLLLEDCIIFDQDASAGSVLADTFIGVENIFNMLS